MTTSRDAVGRHPELERDDTPARDHDVPYLALAEFENVLEQFVMLRFEDAAPLAFFKEVPKLIGRMAARFPSLGKSEQAAVATAQVH